MKNDLIIDHAIAEAEKEGRMVELLVLIQGFTNKVRSERLQKIKKEKK